MINIYYSISLQSLIEKYCPHIAAGGVSCCDTEQLKNLDEKIKPVMILARCPACLENFLKHICGMTCAPNQSEFLKPTVGPFNSEYFYYFVCFIRTQIFHRYFTYTHTNSHSHNILYLNINDVKVQPAKFF